MDKLESIVERVQAGDLEATGRWSTGSRTWPWAMPTPSPETSTWPRTRCNYISDYTQREVAEFLETPLTTVEQPSARGQKAAQKGDG